MIAAALITLAVLCTLAAFRKAWQQATDADRQEELLEALRGKR